MSSEFVKILNSAGYAVTGVTVDNPGGTQSAINVISSLITPLNGAQQTLTTPSAIFPYSASLFLAGIKDNLGAAWTEAAGNISVNLPCLYDDQDGLWVPQYSTNENAAFAEQTLATGSGTQTLATLENTRDYKGLALTFTLAGMTGGTDYVQIKLSAGAGTYTLLVSGVLGQDGTYTLRIGPSFTNVPGLVANDRLPRQIQIKAGYNVSADTTVNCTANWFN